MNICYMFYNPNATINGDHWFKCNVCDSKCDEILNKNGHKYNAMEFVELLILSMHQLNEQNNTNYDIAIISIEMEA